MFRQEKLAILDYAMMAVLIAVFLIFMFAMLSPFINTEFSPEEFQTIAESLCADFGGEADECVVYGANLTVYHQTDIVACADRAVGSNGIMRSDYRYYVAMKTCVRDMDLDYKSLSSQ